jgi:tetratricopeptide (TPR) repeat protein
LPALKDLERSQRTKEETFLLADGYYCLGDVHHFNGVPRAAAKAYRRSARFDPSQGAAFRELGGMLASTGQRAGALAALRKAIRKDPDDNLAKRDLACVEQSDDTIEYHEGDKIWQANELLARGRAKEALREVAGLRRMSAKLVRARAFGLLEDIQATLSQWQKIANARDSVALEYADWYYLPTELYDDSRFWKALTAIGSRLEDGAYPVEAMPDGPLGKVLRGPVDPRSSSKAARAHRLRCRRLWIRMELAISCEDVKALEKMAQKYPGWSSPIEELKRLRGEES